MRPLRFIVALCAAAVAVPLAGCGSADEEVAAQPAAASPAPAPRVDRDKRAEEIKRQMADVELLPTPAARDARPSAAVQRKLDAGVPAVVDLIGRVGIRPRELQIATGGDLEDIEWSKWGAREAIGRGRLRALVCDPDCARGIIEMREVTIRLKKPVACPRGRFFGASEVEAPDVAPADQPTSWLAAPCAGD